MQCVWISGIELIATATEMDTSGNLATWAVIG